MAEKLDDIKAERDAAEKSMRHYIDLYEETGRKLGEAQKQLATYAVEVAALTKAVSDLRGCPERVESMNCRACGGLMIEALVCVLPKKPECIALESPKSPRVVELERKREEDARMINAMAAEAVRNRERIAELEAREVVARAEYKRALDDVKKQLDEANAITHEHSLAQVAHIKQQQVKLDAYAVEVAALTKAVGDLTAELERTKKELVEYQELKRNKCEAHHGARMACGQCFDSQRLDLDYARVDLASTQAVNAELLKALREAIGTHGERCDDVNCQTRTRGLEALAQPEDDSTLRKLLVEAAQRTADSCSGVKAHRFHANPTHTAEVVLKGMKR